MEKTQNWPYLWPRHNAKHLGACFHATEEAPLLSIEEFQIQLSSSSLRAEIREVLLEMSQNIPWPPLGKVHSEFHIDQFGGWVLRFFQLFLTEFPNLLAGSNEPCKKEELSKVKKIIWKASTLGHHLYDTCSHAQLPPSFFPEVAKLSVQFGDIVSEDIQLSWDGKQDQQDVAQHDHCWEQALGIASNNVSNKLIGSTAQVINWLFGSRKSWGNKSKSVYLPKVLPKIQLSTVEDWVQITEPLAQTNWVTACNAGCMRRNIFPQFSDVNKSPFKIQ